MNRTVTVYGLRSSEDGELRYVGQTTQSLAKRLDAHIHCPKVARRSHVFRWISSVRKRGFQVHIFALVENAIWNTTEIELIARYRKDGVRLVNISPGGDGYLGQRSEEFKRKLSAARKGMKFTDEHKANMSRAVTGRKLTAEHKLKVSLALKGRLPKNLGLLKAAVTGKPKSAEHRAKLSAALTGRDVRKEARDGLAY